MLFTSQIVTKASGSMGGVTASHNRFGQYFRARATPVNPSTAFQIAVRANLANYASKWTTLTALQRDAWDTYGDNVPVVNKVGEVVFLTGFNHYVRTNTLRVQAGLEALDDAPTNFTVADFVNPTFTVGVAVGGTAAATIAFDDTEAWTAEDGSALVCWIARPVSQTRNFFKGPFRFLAALAGDSGAPAATPFLPAAGPFAVAVDQLQYLAFRLLAADGRVSTQRIVQAVIA